MNTLKTTFLMVLLTVLLVGVSGMLGGRNAMIIALVFATVINFFTYWFSDKLVLKMYKAQEVSVEQAPWLHEMVEKLAHAANIPKPKVYIVPMDVPNAFATGRNPKNAAVAVTNGIVNLLDREELEGVLAHEISHVKNRDTLISVVAATIAGAIMVLANMARWAAIFGGVDRDDEGGGIFGLIAMSIIAPLAAVLVQMAISRTREYKADSSGAQISKKPWALASALEKMESYALKRPLQVNPTTANLFIINPLHRKGLLNLFSTHPPIEERVKRLRNMIG